MSIRSNDHFAYIVRCPYCSEKLAVIIDDTSDPCSFDRIVDLGDVVKASDLGRYAEIAEDRTEE